MGTGKFIPLETIYPSSCLCLTRRDGCPLAFSQTLTLSSLAMLHPIRLSVIRPLARLPAKHPLTGTPARQEKNILILISSMAMNTQDLTLPTTQRIVLGYSKPGKRRGLAIVTKEVRQSRVEGNYEGLFLIGTGVLYKNRRGRSW